MLSADHSGSTTGEGLPPPPATAGTGLMRSLAVQKRVVVALLLREVLTRYGRNNIGFLWLFLEPMMFTLGVTALWYAIGAHKGSDLPIQVFALTGYSSVLLWRNMPARCLNAVTANFSLMYHRNVKVIDIFASRLLLEVAGATVSFVVLAVLFTYLGVISPPEDLLLIFGGWVLLAWFGGALAILVGALSEEYHLVEKFWHPASYLMFPLSGAGFLVDPLPSVAQEFLLYFPMVNCVEMVRDGYFGSQFVAHYDVGYVVMVNAFITLLGLAQSRVVSRSTIPE